MKYLRDGDPASNTLSWRWTAGLQTKGKNYVAQEWNIKKFTNQRYEKIKLNENAIPLVSDKEYVQINPEFNNCETRDDQTLFIFDNQLCFEESDFKNYKFKKIILIQNTNLTRSIELDECLVKFKSDLISDQQTRLQDKFEVEIKEISYLKNFDLSNVIALYPGIGENLDFLIENNINFKYLYRKFDQMNNQYCNKGFFNFKKFIPKILSKLDELWLSINSIINCIKPAQNIKLEPGFFWTET